MRCQSCGSDNPEGVNFCIECAAPFKNRCPHCGFENLARAKFCGECATPLVQQSQVQSLKSKVENLSDSRLQTLDPRPVSYTPPHLAERILAEQAAMEARGATEGERKTITALFADIKGSMDLIEDLDPEEARSIIDPALQLMMDAVHRYEGYVAQSTGDGIFALFGAPLACEDHPQRALYAALRMQQEGKRFAEQLRLEKGLNFQIRVGLNTGEMVLRSIRKDDLHTDYAPIGHSTSLASRMEGLATPGSIVVSEQTYKLAKGYFEFKSLGAARVKGVSEPINIYEVLGVGPLRTRLQVAVKRGLVRFVGRQTEIGQLRRAFEQAQAGQGQIVGVVGEPGVGKSRLFHEFVGEYGRTSLPSQPGCLVLETFSVSHGKVYPYLPIIDLLKNYFQFALQDDERKRREKVGGKVLMLDRTLEDMLPYLFALLGISEPTSSLAQMDPQIRKQRTFEAIKRLLVRESLNQPLILILEDLHWLDMETQAFLSLLGESIATARILLLVNYRPEYRHEWGSKTYYTQLRLDSLGKDDAQELLTALLGDRTELPDLKRLIVEKTEGNPFFMEEIVQALVEQGVLADPRKVGTAHPHVETHGFGLAPSTGHAPLPTDLHIPTTVQAVLASRIDRLPPEEKEFLQTLSVIGKEFPFSLLKQVVNKSEDELQRLLSHLQAAEFIYEQPAFPEVEYTFKHALTQEVSYNSLLIERRKILHERTAQAIEMLFHSQLEDHCGDLAHHYSCSGNTPKAVEYLQRSGQQAAQRSAYAEASGHFTAALELLKNLPDTPECAQQELTLQLALAASLQATKGPSAPEVGQAYTRARALCQEGEETPQLFSVLRGLWVLHHVRAELSAARELGEQLLSMAKRVQDPALLLEAHRALGSTLLWQGEFPLARAHLEQASALYDPQLHRSLTFLHGGADPGVSCLCEFARVLWFLGYPDQALQRSQAALLLAQSLSDPFSVGFALIFAAGIHQFRREGYATQKRAEEGITLASEQGFAPLVFAGTIRRGWALTEQGQVEAGLTQMQEGLTARQTTGAE
ncbi:MAG TPA: adenylate/guanylate cyclase domain-containing protein, partial [Candidatus Binatia bacterium]|nr:adenylate/guanylate cyclase domain-containing protein [Candidatus Binatia bacterium]